MQPRSRAKKKIAALLSLAVLVTFAARAETTTIVIPTNAAPRVVFGAEKIAEALKAVRLEAKSLALIPSQVLESSSGRHAQPEASARGSD